VFLQAVLARIEAIEESADAPHPWRPYETREWNFKNSWLVDLYLCLQREMRFLARDKASRRHPHHYHQHHHHQQQQHQQQQQHRHWKPFYTKHCRGRRQTPSASLDRTT
jgi:hypothetical protein